MAEGLAAARAALAGNPSDGYGGTVLAFTLDELSARAQTRPGPPEPQAPELVRATVARFAREHVSAAAGTRIEWSTTTPARWASGARARS